MGLVGREKKMDPGPRFGVVELAHLGDRIERLETLDVGLPRIILEPVD